MDFHSMKRKELQGLCKKHGIAANSTNLEMANQLASLLKEKEKPVARGKSCLRSNVEQPSETLSDGVNMQSKKVRFSPENETIEFLKSETKPEKLGRGARRKPVSVVEIDDIVSTENVGNGKFLRDNLNSPIRLTRSKAEKVTSEDENLAVIDAPKTKTARRGSRSVAGNRVSTVESTVTRRSLAKKEVENKKEVRDDAVLRKNSTKRISRKSDVEIDEVPDDEVASMKEIKEVDVDVVLKKNQPRRTSRSRVVKSGPEITEIAATQKVVTRSNRNKNQIEDNEELNQGLGEAKVVRGGRSKRQRGYVTEDAKAKEVALESATEVVLEVEEPSRRSSRYGSRRQDESESNTLAKSTKFEENARSKRSSTSYKSNKVSETILTKNDTKKKPRRGKSDPVLEEKNVVIEESTLVEEAPRRSSRNSSRRQSIMAQTEKMGTDKSKGKIENSVGNKKPRSRRLDPVLEEGTAEIEDSSLVVEPIKKSTRNSTKAQKSLVTIHAGKVVPRKKLQGTIKEPNARSKLSEDIIPVVEQVVNSQPTMPDVAEGSNSPVTNSREVLSANADEESGGEIPNSVNENNVVEGVKSELSQDCATNEDNFNSNNLAILESKVELNTAMDLVPPEASHVGEDYSHIDQRDCEAKAADDIDSQNEMGMAENNDMNIETSDSAKQDHEESQGEIPISVFELNTVEVDKSKLSQDCATNEDDFDSDNSALLEPKVDVNIAMDVVHQEASLGEEDYSQINQQDYKEKEADDMDSQNEFGMGENNDVKSEAFGSAKQVHEETQQWKEVTPSKMEVKVSDEVENLENIEPEDGGKLKCDFINEDAEESSFLDTFIHDSTTASQVEQQEEDEVEISPLGSTSLECTNSSSWVSVVKREPMVENLVINNPDESNVSGLMTAADPTMLDLDVTESSRSPTGTKRDDASNYEEQQLSREATPISVSEEVRSLMLINLENTPVSEFGKAQYSKLQEDHATSASAIDRQVEVSNKVPLENLVDMPSSPFTSYNDFEVEDPEFSKFTVSLEASQEAPNSGEQSKIHRFDDGSSTDSEEIEGTETEFDADHNTVTAEDEAQPFQATSPQTAEGHAECQDIVEIVRSPWVTSKDNASSLEQRHPIRAATPLSVSNEIKSLMMVNMDRTPVSESGKVHNLMLQEVHATSGFRTGEPVEYLANITNEVSCDAHYHPSFSWEDHVDKPKILDSCEQTKSQSLGDGSSTDSEESEGKESEFDADHNALAAEGEAQLFQSTSPQTARGLAACQDIEESAQSPCVSSRDNASSLEQRHSIKAATPLSVSNEIRSLMLANLDRTPVSELGKVHNLMLQEVHATSAIGAIERIEDLAKVTNESSSDVHHHSPSAKEDEEDKPNNPSSLFEDFEMKRSEPGTCTVNLNVSQKAHGSDEKIKSQNFGYEYSMEAQESEGKETDCDTDNNTVRAEGDTLPFQATYPQTTSGHTENQGYGCINIELSPTELRLFDEKQHEDDQTVVKQIYRVYFTQSKNDDANLCSGNNLDTEEKNRDAIIQEDLPSPTECKDGDTRAIGSYGDSFDATPCLESKNSANFLVFSASASKSIYTNNLLDKEKKGIDEMVPDHALENASRVTDTPGDSDILSCKNAERNLTSPIRDADSVVKDQNDVLVDNLNCNNPEEMRPATFDSDKRKVAWELSEDEDSGEVERDLTQFDEGAFDDLDGHEMEIVKEMFQAEEVDSPSDSEVDSPSDSEVDSSLDSDHYSGHEKASMEENASKSTDISLQKEETIDDTANFVSNEISAMEDFLESSQKSNKRIGMADECADKQNMTQASQSWLPDTATELGNSQDILGSNMFSSWELNLFSESEATKPAPVVSKVSVTEVDEKVFGCEEKSGSDNYSVEGFVDTFINLGDHFCGDKTLKGTNEAKEVNDDGLEIMDDEATEACEAPIKYDSITDDTPLRSAERAVLGGSGAEDLEIVKNSLDTQEQINSSRKDYLDVGTGLEEEYIGMKINLCESELRTVEGEGDAMKVDVFGDPREGHNTDAAVEEQNFKHSEVQNLSQDFTANTIEDDATVASSSFNKNQPFEIANAAVKEGSAAEDTEQKMESVNEENTVEKAEKGELSVFETNSTISKHKRSSLIQKTPKKLAGSVDMKENATSIKRENLGSTIAKSTAKRRALVERPKWI